MVEWGEMYPCGTLSGGQVSPCRAVKESREDAIIKHRLAHTW